MSTSWVLSASTLSAVTSKDEEPMVEELEPELEELLPEELELPPLEEHPTRPATAPAAAAVAPNPRNDLLDRPLFSSFPCAIFLPFSHLPHPSSFISSPSDGWDYPYAG